MIKTCTHCYDRFDAKYANQKLCLACWRKRERAFERYDEMRYEIVNLRGQLAAAKTKGERNTDTLPDTLRKKIRSLCHPDRHTGTPREQHANEVLQWLNTTK